MSRLPSLHNEIVRCRACPRLVEWRERVAREKVARFRECEYWGRPVPGFGDAAARILILGLAPGAHGANRTGRMFTGDGSGDFLFAALHRAGLATQPTSVARGDGLRLRGVYIVAVIRCAPPKNAPKPDEIAQCSGFLDRETALLPDVRVVLALGAIAWRAYFDQLSRSGNEPLRPRPRFAHGGLVEFSARPTLVGSYHVSRQNTQTGKLTPAMFDAVLETATRCANLDPASRGHRRGG